jgi:N-acetylneuraminate synthase
MRNLTVEVAGNSIGRDHEPKVIAEIGINHGGSLLTAKEMALAAITGGAHFVKHQTHIADKEMSREAESVVPGNSQLSIYEIIRQSSLSEEEEFDLMTYVNGLGGVFISTPFSREAADRLDSWDVPAFKIGSGECNNYPLVEHIAKKGRPVFLSTGMNSISSIKKSVSILEDSKIPYVLLHTTNLYPTPHHLLRLNALDDMSDAFPGIPLGLSDHSTSNSACVASVVLGARLLERHFTDSKTDRSGPDIVCSMDSLDLRDLVKFSREVFLALGGTKLPAPEELVTMNFAFASVSALLDIQEGELFTLDNVYPIRPAGGDFSPGTFHQVLGKRSARNISSRTQIKYEDVSN